MIHEFPEEESRTSSLNRNTKESSSLLLGQTAHNLHVVIGYLFDQRWLAIDYQLAQRTNRVHSYS